MPAFLKDVRRFEADCEKWDEKVIDDKNQQRILPPKTTATDDSTEIADRSEREIINILHSLPKEAVEKISPSSLPLKSWIKLP